MKDKKDNFKNKILEKYFEFEEEPEETTKEATVDYMEDHTAPQVETVFVADEVAVVKKPTIISSETVIHGNLDSTNDLEISGKIIGDIMVQGMVKVMSGSVTGNIKATKIYIKDSTIDGNIESESMIDIIDNSHINGNILGGDIVINSRCKGNITARERLELLQSAIVRGDLQTKSIKIDEGAIVEGYLRMNQ